MVKHCYKTFLVSLICWSLLTMQTGIAFAGVNETPNAVTTDDKGNITSSKTYTFDPVKESDMLASIAMLAGGFITARMIKSYKPVTTDVMVAAAGGAAFLAGEVLSNINFKGKIDEMTVTVEKHSDQTINEEQQQRLIDLKKSYEEAKKSTKTKKTLQLAAAAAFGVAALTATYMAFQEEAQVGICRAALQTAKATLSSCVATGALAAATVVAAAEGKACGLCVPKILPYEFAFNKYNISRIPPGDSNTKDKSNNGDQTFLRNPINYCSDSTGATTQGVSKSIKAACDTAVVTLGRDEVATPPGELKVDPKVLYNPSDLIKNILKLPVVTEVKPTFFEKVLDVFFPKAEAGWLPLLGFAASTAAAFYMITGETATKIDMLMFIPRNRAIAFGLLAALSYAASKSSDNVIKQLDENIKKIDDILNDIEKLGKGVKAKDVKQLVGTVKPSAAPVVLPTNATDATPCLGSNSTSNCTPISSLVSSSSGFNSLPESLQSLANDAIKLGDGVSGTSTLGAGTLSSAESLGNKQAAIGRALAKAQNDISKRNTGKDKTTPAQQQTNLLNSLGAGIKKGLQQKGMSPSGFLGSVGGAGIDSSLANSKLAEKEELIVKGGKGPDAIDMGSPKGEDLKLDFKDQNLSISPGGTGAASAAPEYEIGANEISNENGPSIFEVISSRYLKSGYPKLLEVEPTKK